jgi:hypothetical protein
VENASQRGLGRAQVSARIVTGCQIREAPGDLGLKPGPNGGAPNFICRIQQKADRRCINTNTLNSGGGRSAIKEKNMSNQYPTTEDQILLRLSYIDARLSWISRREADTAWVNGYGSHGEFQAERDRLTDETDLLLQQLQSIGGSIPLHPR